MVRGEEGEKGAVTCRKGDDGSDPPPAPTEVGPEDSAQDKLTPPGCRAKNFSSGLLSREEIERGVHWPGGRGDTVRRLVALQVSNVGVTAAARLRLGNGVGTKRKREA